MASPKQIGIIRNEWTLKMTWIEFEITNDAGVKRYPPCPIERGLMLRRLRQASYGNRSYSIRVKQVPETHTWLLADCAGHLPCS